MCFFALVLSTAGTACSTRTGDDGASCAVTHDWAKLSVVSNGVDELSCQPRDGSASQPMTAFTHRGTARSVTAKSFELECPDGDCSMQPLAVGVDAPGLDLTRSLAERAAVRIIDRAIGSFACTSGIAVEATVPTGDAGTDTEPSLLFAVGEGASPPTDLVTISFDKIDCPYPWANKSCGAVSDDSVGIYAMTTRADFIEKPLTARMGETAKSAITGSAHVLRERNLRSYQSDGCDDYWNYAGLGRDRRR